MSLSLTEMTSKSVKSYKWFSVFLSWVLLFQKYLQARIWEIQNVQYYHYPGLVSNQCWIPWLFVSGLIFMEVRIQSSSFILFHISFFLWLSLSPSLVLLTVSSIPGALVHCVSVWHYFAVTLRELILLSNGSKWERFVRHTSTSRKWMLFFVIHSW